MYPDFVCIGAQKAGTTWLYYNLRQHQQVWLPPVKEVHYFDHKPPSLYKRLFGRPAHFREARRYLVKSLPLWRDQNSVENLRWAVHYCLGRRNDEWYKSLFPGSGDFVTGEICPGYARLGESQVKEFHRKMPDTKIIYLLRNPVERAWSTTVMHFNKEKFGGIDNISDERIIAHFSDQRTLLHGDYLDNLATWQKYYPENMHVGFFDELTNDAAVFYVSILRFLGLDSSPAAIPVDVSVKRNKGTITVIPSKYHALLGKLYGDQIVALHERFNNRFTKEWLESVRHL